MAREFLWNVEAATNAEDLMNVLFAAASGLKTQVLDSPFLKQQRFQQLRDRLSEIADELHGLQQDVVIRK